MSNNEAVARDFKILEEFIALYCRDHHQEEAGTGDASATMGASPGSLALCADCRGLLAYAKLRRSQCPHDPKPACRRCPTHCYRPERRAKIREVMRYSGIRLAAAGGLRRLRGLFSPRGRPPAAVRGGSEEAKAAHP